MPPESAPQLVNQKRKLAHPRAVLRVVEPGEDPGTLPADSRNFDPRARRMRTSYFWIVTGGLIFVLVQLIGAVFLFVNPFKDGKFDPESTLFLLAPAAFGLAILTLCTIFIIRRVLSDRGTSKIFRAVDESRTLQSAHIGTVSNVWAGLREVRGGNTGFITYRWVGAIEIRTAPGSVTPTGDFIVSQFTGVMSPGRAPTVGSSAHVWLDPSGVVLVQVEAGGDSSAHGSKAAFLQA